jgi:hypothetical protein
MADEDCPFKVVRTNGSDEVLARSVNLIIGLGSYVALLLSTCCASLSRV